MTRHNSIKYTKFDQYMRRHPDALTYKGRMDVVQLYRQWQESWDKCVSLKEEMMGLVEDM